MTTPPSPSPPVPPNQAKLPEDTIPLEAWSQAIRRQLGEAYPPSRSERDRMPGYAGPPARYPVRHAGNIVYGKAGGETLCMEGFLPEGAPAPRPAIAIFHGGGWRDRGQSRFLEADQAVWYAARGFVAVSPSYRLAPRHRWPAMLEDAQRVIAWLRTAGREYGVDPDRVAAAGLSAGAHLAVLLGLLDAAEEGGGPVRTEVSTRANLCLPRATPLLVWRASGLGARQPDIPAGHVFGEWAEMEGVRAAIYEEVHGAPLAALPETPPRWFSPLEYVTPAAAPTFITHSSRDYLPLVNPAALYDSLRRAGKTVGDDLELDLVDGTGHPKTHALNLTAEGHTRHDQKLWAFVTKHFGLADAP